MLTLEINISKLKKNLDYIRHKLDKTELCAVVKAEAYGHGFKIAEFIDPYCTSFAVASGTEASKLRAFTEKKIYVLGGFDAETFADGVDIVYTVSSFDQIEKAEAYKVDKIALKVNSGMNRLGFSISEIPSALKIIKSKGLNLDSIYTHFFDPPSSIADQLKLFNSVDFTDLKRHCYASNFLHKKNENYFDTVRCGLAMYGYGNKGVTPILSAYARVVNVHKVKKGEFIGYGRTRALTDTTVAVVNAGYADGINRMNTGKNIEINGFLCPILGNICMDMCMVDVGGRNVSEGDKAYFISEKINAEELAERCNTIVYEILTSFRGRVRRIYI